MGSKRAGRKKHRNGTQRHPPGPTKREPTIERDDLDPNESLALEVRAIANGWLVGDQTFDAYREALIKKAMTMALNPKTDPEMVVKILRTISNAELKQQQVKIAAFLATKQKPNDLPAQVNVGVQIGASEQQEPQKPAYLVIQELIKRKDVRAAIDRRHNIADQSSDSVDQGAISASATS